MRYEVGTGTTNTCTEFIKYYNKKDTVSIIHAAMHWNPGHCRCFVEDDGYIKCMEDYIFIKINIILLTRVIFVAKYTYDL